MPPVALRDIAPTGKKSDSFFSVDPTSPVLVTTKPGEDDGWVALRLQNLSDKTSSQTVTFTHGAAGARSADPVEHPGNALALDGNKLSVELAGREIRTVLVRFAAQA